MYRSDVKRDFSLIRFVIRIEDTSQMTTQVTYWGLLHKRTSSDLPSWVFMSC